MGALELRARKDIEIGILLLKPCSPLATEIHGTWMVGGKPDTSTLDKLNEHIIAYLNGEDFAPAEEKTASGQVIPAVVLSKLESVVCLKAQLQNRHIQFSGFIIDQEGLILSTAHDLKGLREITVVVYDGREFKGNLIRVDCRRDLAFIDIDTKVSTFIWSQSPGHGRMALFRWMSHQSEGNRLSRYR
jgi:S1-C subfamily serine protease